MLTELVITAQCVLFYIAGYDTTATTLSFVSYCLALHPGVQQRCMDEVERVLAAHGGEITYEALAEMTYLDMVFAGKKLYIFSVFPHFVSLLISYCQYMYSTVLYSFSTLCLIF